MTDPATRERSDRGAPKRRRRRRSRAQREKLCVFVITNNTQQMALTPSQEEFLADQWDLFQEDPTLPWKTLTHLVNSSDTDWWEPPPPPSHPSTGSTGWRKRAKTRHADVSSSSDSDSETDSTQSSGFTMNPSTRTLTSSTISQMDPPPPKKMGQGMPMPAVKDVKGNHRNWAGTLNNPSVHLPNWQQALTKDALLPHGVVALVAALEVGEEGTPHLQMAFVTDAMKFATAKALFPPQLHLEVARNPKGAWRYCLKGNGARVEWDTRYARDKKKALADATAEQTSQAYQSALSGDASLLLAQVTPEYLFKNAHSIYRNLAVAPQLTALNSVSRVQPLCMWLFGGSGCGKTTFALELAGKMTGRASTYFLPVPDSGGKAWFDGFTASHQMVVMDEFRPSTISLPRLCQVLSAAPTKVECKGASVNFTSSVVVIISPVSPWECYSHLAEEDQTQVVRRVDVCLEFRPRRSQQQPSTSLPQSSSFVMPLPDGAAATASSAFVRNVPTAQRWAQVRERVNERFDEERCVIVTRHWWEYSTRNKIQEDVCEEAALLLEAACYRVVDADGNEL